MGKHGRHKDPPWTPFEDAEIPNANWPKDEVPVRVLLNSRYQVLVYEKRMLGEMRSTPITHLSIKRRDKEPIHDWREMQRIKNEVCGPDREAVELYPAERRLMDTSNQFHLWVLPEGMGFPFGYIDRAIVRDSGNGSKQRPFEEVPADALTAAEADAKLRADHANRGLILRPRG